ncbi:YceD family protein [Tsuneonella amylolytica]|uniref:YceD family protein n=1 Tax=Tsuneonella amylolytica TaxID=2338327 RepID=UPI000EA9E8B4|nr:YceD family protein [Tsuneonella amylolytica]
MSAAEFSRIVKVRPHPPQSTTLEANDEERAALAHRVGVTAIEALSAELSFTPEGDAIVATGTLAADVIQPCAVSGEDFAVHLKEPLHLRFVRALSPVAADEEIELADDEPDEIEFDGEIIDVGEAVAQSLALAVDPYAMGPDADAARRAAGIEDESAPRGPLAEGLAALRKT